MHGVSPGFCKEGKGVVVEHSYINLGTERITNISGKWIIIRPSRQGELPCPSNVLL